MTTTTRLNGLGGWLVRCTSVVVAMAFCATALADPSKNVVSLPNKQSAQKTTRKVCYVVISGSGIPQPCDRLVGAIPTTAAPMDVIR
jgi:hypothetical protein